jgi:pyruvate dehydrogenase E2 component (dihydrolipoamide acetyltransferase)
MSDGDGGTSASPLAQRYAAASGVDLAAVSGTGPYGRILKRDVVAVQDAPASTGRDLKEADPAQPTVESSDPPLPSRSGANDSGGAKGRVEVQELGRLQQVVARRMAESKATVPDFALSAEVDMEEAVALRRRLKAMAPDGAVVPSLNDFVIKACAVALRRHPRANGSYLNGRFELYEHVNIGVAVAAENALVVPVISDADAKSLGAIATEVGRLAERVREGRITPPELAGGTFTVSNLGRFGVRSFQAVVNPPQAAILAVGEMGPRAVVRDGAVVARRQMSVTLSCDHRILYGADAAQFLGEIRRILESPLSLAF